MKNKILLSLFTALALAGCATQEGAYEPRHTTGGDLENTRNVVLMDQAVQNSVTTAGMQENILPDGRFEVVANLRNRLERRIQVQVSCVFKDARGFSTGDETPWQNLILTEKTQESVRFISANNKAQRYTIRVRQAH